MSRDALEILARAYVPRRHRCSARLSQRRAQRWLVSVCTVCLVVLAVLAYCTRARADELGGCWSEGKWCAGPSAAATVAEFNLATGKFSGGISPGIGFGLTFERAKWYATGAALYMAFSVGGSQPNHARPAVLISFAHYVRFGVALDVTEQAVGGPLAQLSILFGVGAGIGGGQ